MRKRKMSCAEKLLLTGLGCLWVTAALRTAESLSSGLLRPILTMPGALVVMLALLVAAGLLGAGILQTLRERRFLGLCPWSFGLMTAIWCWNSLVAAWGALSVMTHGSPWEAGPLLLLSFALAFRLRFERTPPLAPARLVTR